VGELVGKHNPFDFDAVHRDDAGLGVGIDLFLVIGLYVQLRPVTQLPFEWNTCFDKWIKTHSTTS
jgi:hypothetical protein